MFHRAGAQGRNRYHLAARLAACAGAQPCDRHLAPRIHPQATRGAGHERGYSRHEPAWESIAPCVDEALAALPEDLRTPLLLHYFEGRSQSEVAESTGVEPVYRLPAHRQRRRGTARTAAAGRSDRFRHRAGRVIGRSCRYPAPAVLLASLTSSGWPVSAGSGLTAVTATAFGTLAGKLIVLLAVGMALTAGIVLLKTKVKPVTNIPVSGAAAVPPLMLASVSEPICTPHRRHCRNLRQRSRIKTKSGSSSRLRLQVPVRE